MKLFNNRIKFSHFSLLSFLLIFTLIFKWLLFLNFPLNSLDGSWDNIKIFSILKGEFITNYYDGNNSYRIGPFIYLPFYFLFPKHLSLYIFFFIINCSSSYIIYLNFKNKTFALVVIIILLMFSYLYIQRPENIAFPILLYFLFNQHKIKNFFVLLIIFFVCLGLHPLAGLVFLIFIIFSNFINLNFKFLIILFFLIAIIILKTLDNNLFYHYLNLIYLRLFDLKISSFLTFFKHAFPLILLIIYLFVSQPSHFKNSKSFFLILFITLTLLNAHYYYLYIIIFLIFLIKDIDTFNIKYCYFLIFIMFIFNNLGANFMIFLNKSYKTSYFNNIKNARILIKNNSSRNYFITPPEAFYISQINNLHFICFGQNEYDVYIKNINLKNGSIIIFNSKDLLTIKYFLSTKKLNFTIKKHTNIHKGVILPFTFFKKHTSEIGLWEILIQNN